MPTFSRIAWETLLEPGVRDSCKSSLNSKQQIPRTVAVVAGGDNDEEEKRKEDEKKARAPHHIYISPALYATPEPTPIPDGASDPLSPSPYVVNHKRRGVDAFSRRSEGSDESSQQKCGDDEKNLDSKCEAVVVVEESVDDDFLGQEMIDGERHDSLALEDDFFDPRSDLGSVASCSEVDDCGKQAENPSYVSNQGEFFDAVEELSLDGSISNLSSSYGPKVESELRDAKLSLLEEIEKRKKAEYVLGRMCSQWQRLSALVYEAGLSFPAPSHASGMQFDNNSLEQFCQEIVVARFVAEAIGRGMAHAEAEVAAEAIIESKDHEISRLRDRLQYYEAVNREMCQRNQEIVEAARKQRQRKRIQRRWLWGCGGLSVVIGASVIGYSYLPEVSKHHMLLSSSNSSAASRITSPESA